MEFPEKTDLIDRYQKYTDEELFAILNHPKDYQDVAVEAAREVAEARGLEFEVAARESHDSKFRIFPTFSSAEKAMSLIKSIQRLLYFIALIPFITAAMSFTDGYPSLALVYAGIAIMWAVIAFLAVRRRRHQMVLLLFLLFIFLMVLRYMTAGLPVDAQIVDWVVFGIIFLAVVYLLVYFKILISDYLSKA